MLGAMLYSLNYYMLVVILKINVFFIVLHMI